MTFNELFEDIPVGRTLTNHWAQQDPNVLDTAASIIIAHDANPWVFAGDSRHREQFSGEQEQVAWDSMSDTVRSALDPFYEV